MYDVSPTCESPSTALLASTSAILRRYEKEESLKRFESLQYTSRKAAEAIKTPTKIRSSG